MQVDQDGLRRKNEEIMQAYREKSRKYLQTQELYDKLKRRAMLGQVQDAASDAVNHAIQASVTANRFVDRAGNQNQRPQPPPPPLFSDHQSSGMQNSGQVGGVGTNIAPQFDRNGNAEATWAGFSSQGSSHRMAVKPHL
jgi:E3 ubiquitin-protein ligase CCNP1IP1